MARSRQHAGSRGRRRARTSEQGEAVPLDTGGLLRQVGTFEAGNGFAHDLFAIGIAIVLALLVRPTVHLLRALTRR